MNDDPTIQPEVDPADLALRVYGHHIEEPAVDVPQIDPVERTALSEAQRALVAVFVIVAVCCLIGLGAIAGDGRADGRIDRQPDRTVHPFLAPPDRGIAVLPDVPTDAEDHLVNNEADRTRGDIGQGLFGS